VTFDLDLDLEHTLDACLPGDHRVQVWWRSGQLSARRSDLSKSLQTDRRTDDGRFAIVLAHSWNELKKTTNAWLKRAVTSLVDYGDSYLARQTAVSWWTLTMFNFVCSWLTSPSVFSYVQTHFTQTAQTSISSYSRSHSQSLSLTLRLQWYNLSAAMRVATPRCALMRDQQPRSRLTRTTEE